jgi:hypothetical protein
MAVLGEKTRIKVTIGLILLVSVEAILKHFFTGIPFVEAVTAQVAIGGWYLQKKSDENKIKIGLNNGQDN